MTAAILQFYTYVYVELFFYNKNLISGPIGWMAGWTDMYNKYPVTFLFVSFHLSVQMF